MKKVLLLLLSANLAWGWGFWAHRRINRLAIFALPESLFAFYRPYIEYITRQSTKPDERRVAFPSEPPKHYIDLDRYPANLPRQWREAVALLTEDTLHAHGILPWHLEKCFWDLVRAFKSREVGHILKLSAEIGHYLADAHVPLHTTSNYNGQLTGQHGVHGLWEALIPESFGEEYDYWIGRAYVWYNTRETLWTIIQESHALVPIVLGVEKEATAIVGEERKYTYRVRGRQTIRSYSYEFLQTYHKLLRGMVESRIRWAVLRLASFWYTAWQVAGRPSLSGSIVPVDSLPEDSIPEAKISDPRCGEVGISPYLLLRISDSYACVLTEAFASGGALAEAFQEICQGFGDIGELLGLAHGPGSTVGMLHSAPAPQQYLRAYSRIGVLHKREPWGRKETAGESEYPPISEVLQLSVHRRSRWHEFPQPL
ncbi:MAG: zinc dependent phospholipase C family protein [Bacteroidia bacterium]|nr:zinc dependent phospholipase C family protein [Bacteroidia bacterium]MDW8134726.1 zinc dependent phospholipase C family protein [Bacteroidia bacterium]